MESRGVVEIQLVGLVLGEIPYLQLARAAQLTVHRLQAAGQQLRHGRLAVAVGAEQRDALVGIEAQGHLVQDRLAGLVADGDVVHHDQRRRQFLGLRELELDAALLDHRRDRLHLGSAFRRDCAWRALLAL